MRRTFGVLTAVLLVIGMAACQDEGGGTVTLVFSDWHLTEPHWEDSLKEGIATFEEEHPDIRVKLDYVAYDQKETKYQTEMEAGEGPDVVHLHAYSLQSFIQRGYLLSLDEFIEAEGGEEFIGSWYPKTLELMQAEDNYFAIPGDFMAMVLMYNREHFRQVGLSKPPATW
jgi:ABC-type glycerol-3-phosphate transport system substrate-binding protein